MSFRFYAVVIRRRTAPERRGRRGCSECAAQRNRSLQTANLPSIELLLGLHLRLGVWFRGRLPTASERLEERDGIRELRRLRVDARSLGLQVGLLRG